MSCLIFFVLFPITPFMFIFCSDSPSFLPVLYICLMSQPLLNHPHCFVLLPLLFVPNCFWLLISLPDWSQVFSLPVRRTESYSATPGVSVSVSVSVKMLKFLVQVLSFLMFLSTTLFFIRPIYIYIGAYYVSSVRPSICLSVSVRPFLSAL